MISKAAVNAFVSQVHSDDENITASHPRIVDTDLLAPYKHHAPEPPISIEESVADFMKVVDEATKESTGGKFLQWNGEVVRF